MSACFSERHKLLDIYCDVHYLETDTTRPINYVRFYMRQTNVKVLQSRDKRVVKKILRTCRNTKTHQTSPRASAKEGPILTFKDQHSARQRERRASETLCRKQDTSDKHSCQRHSSRAKWQL